VLAANSDGPGSTLVGTQIVRVRLPNKSHGASTLEVQQFSMVIWNILKDK
jgi:hypothetical protein